MTRQDRRPRQRMDPAARQSAILAAAADAFAERPYDEVSVAAVAEAAGASQALVFRYFGSKAGLFAAIVEAAIDLLAAQQQAALATLPADASVTERLRASTLVYLGHIAHYPVGWSEPLRGAHEPSAVIEIRRRAREAYVRALAELIGDTAEGRGDYALWGYFGFLDAAALRWVDRGCPDEHREPLVAAALDALEGALGRPVDQSTSGER